MRDWIEQKIPNLLEYPHWTFVFTASEPTFNLKDTEWNGCCRY